MVNEKTLEYANAVVNTVFNNNERISVSLVTEEDRTCVLFETAEWMAELTKRMVDVERKSLGRTLTIPMARYDVLTFSYDPGVWRYSDGSGQPPSWDEEDEGTFDSLADALKWIVHTIASGIVDYVMFAKSMEDEPSDEYFDEEYADAEQGDS